MNITTIFLMLGGLGLFLFGMKLMSDGLEQVAGARMRSVLEFFTRNRFVGMLVGLVVTAIIQSSSATTVMVVSFVNSGLMDLAQATGVILGANIGTTVTGQLIAFNLSEVAPLFVMIGVVMHMFGKKPNIKKSGLVVLGFGILFMGLSTMSQAMAVLKESPQIVKILTSLTNPFAAILFGVAVTTVLQSSSATVGIIILLANQELVQFPMCFYLILGCNIGSCASALLASLGAKKAATRAALIHLLFNVIGSAILFVILSFALDPISGFIMNISGGNPGRAVANAHTAMKVAEVLMLFPFMDWVVKATYKIVPGEDQKENTFEPKYIGSKTVLSPATAVVNAIEELKHMGTLATENIRDGMQALCEKDVDKLEEIYRKEAYINYLNKEITDYLVKVNGLEIPLADAKIIGALFHVANDLERIGDHAENFADATKNRVENGIPFSDKALKQLHDLSEIVLKELDYAMEMFSNQTQEHMKEIQDLEDAVDEKEKKLQKSHIKRIAKGKCTPEAGMIFSDTISGLERVADHAINIAFSLMEPDELDVNIGED